MVVPKKFNKLQENSERQFKDIRNKLKNRWNNLPKKTNSKRTKQKI